MQIEHWAREGYKAVNTLADILDMMQNAQEKSETWMGQAWRILAGCHRFIEEEVILARRQAIEQSKAQE